MMRKADFIFLFLFSISFCACAQKAIRSEAIAISGLYRAPIIVNKKISFVENWHPLPDKMNPNSELFKEVKIISDEEASVEISKISKLGVEEASVYRLIRENGKFVYIYGIDFDLMELKELIFKIKKSEKIIFVKKIEMRGGD